MAFAQSAVEQAALQALGRSAGPLEEADLAAVTTLNLGDSGLTDLSDLQKFPNLKVLYLHRNGLQDLSGLAGLTGLEGLDASGNEISDLTPLKGLTQLATLSLTYNQIDDLSPLESLQSLKRLYLMGNQITDLSPLSGLSDLRCLHIEDNPDLTDLSPLQGLTALEEYGGPEVAWPAGSEAIVLGVFISGSSDLEARQTAFGEAMAAAGATYGTVVLSASDSASAWKYFEASQTQSTAVDAIYLCPDPDTDYALTRAKAVTLGKALHIAQAQTGEAIRAEIAALY